MNTQDNSIYRTLAVGVVLRNYAELKGLFVDNPDSLAWSLRALDAYLESIETEVSVATAAHRLLSAVAADVR